MRSTEPSSTAAFYAAERQGRIAALLRERGRVAVPEVARAFTVSEVTARKDLAALEARGLAVRTHGGAIAPAAAPAGAVELEFDRRERLHADEKARIGAAAAALARPGETIALDASTTALALARRLRERAERDELPGLTVVTSGLRTAGELASAPGVTVLMPGGAVRAEALSLVGGWGADLLGRVHVARAFVGAHGCTPEEGLTEVHAEEVAMKRALVEQAREVVALLDASKWGLVALATFCPFARLARVVTVGAVPDGIQRAAAEHAVEIESL